MNVYFCKNIHGKTSDNIARAQTRFFLLFRKAKMFNFHTICGKYITRPITATENEYRGYYIKRNPMLNTVK